MSDPEELRKLDPLVIPAPPKMVKLGIEEAERLGLECDRCGACCYHWFIRNLEYPERSYVVKCVHLLEGNVCEVYDDLERRPADCAAYWCEKVVERCQK